MINETVSINKKNSKDTKRYDLPISRCHVHIPSRKWPHGARVNLREEKKGPSAINSTLHYVPEIRSIIVTIGVFTGRNRSVFLTFRANIILP